LAFLAVPPGVTRRPEENGLVLFAAWARKTPLKPLGLFHPFAFFVLIPLFLFFFYRKEKQTLQRVKIETIRIKKQKNPTTRLYLFSTPPGCVLFTAPRQLSLTLPGLPLVLGRIPTAPLFGVSRWCCDGSPHISSFLLDQSLSGFWHRAGWAHRNTRFSPFFAFPPSHGAPFAR